MQRRRPDLLQDPQSKYSSPERLLRDRTLSNRAKRALLEHWKSDLTSRLTATEENMVAVPPARGRTSSDDEGEMLQRVSNCLRQLDAGPAFAAPQQERRPHSRR